MAFARPPRGKVTTHTRSGASASSTGAGSRAKPDISSSKSSAPAASRTLDRSAATRQQPTKATSTQPSQPRSRAEPTSRVRAAATTQGTLPGAASSSTSLSGVPKARPRAQEAAQIESSKGLQVAAQSCAWRYMVSTLQDGLGNSRAGALAALASRKHELDAEEADIAESRIRYEAERLVDFYDELLDKKIGEEVAAMIDNYTTFETTIGEITNAALRLTSIPLDETTHISRYNEVLDGLDTLEDKHRQLEAQIKLLKERVPSSGGRLFQLLSDLCEIMRGHEETIACAREVVQCCKDNYRIGIGTLTLA